MAKRLNAPVPPYIELAGHQARREAHWTFVVSLVVTVDDRRVLWFGMNYETAMVTAEAKAREGAGSPRRALPVHDVLVHRR